MCWSPNLQCDSIWSWSLWEVIRFRWGYEEGALRMGLVALKEEYWKACSLSPMWGHKKKAATYKPEKKALIRNWTLPKLDLGLSSFQNCEKINLCVSHPHPTYGILLWQPEQTKTPGQEPLYQIFTISLTSYISLPCIFSATSSHVTLGKLLKTSLQLCFLFHKMGVIMEPIS